MVAHGPRAQRDRAEDARQTGEPARLKDPREFRRALSAVDPARRDAWFDDLLSLSEITDDGADLPRDCVPYLPCDVGELTRVAEEAAVGPSDVFVDLGSGVGRAMAFVHLLTGAAAVGIEIQAELALRGRALAARFPSLRVLEGDASELVGEVAAGTVFFLYCPFSGRRLERLIDRLEPIAAARPIRVCSIDVPLPERPWLARRARPSARAEIAYTDACPKQHR